MASASTQPTATAALQPTVETQSNATDVAPRSDEIMEDSANPCPGMCMGPRGFRSLQLQESAARSFSRNPTSATSSMVEREQETDQYNYHQAKKIRGTPNQPAAKKTKGSATVKSENSQVAMPPPKPLGNLKGKYAIETFYACCDDESQRNHDEFCSILLSPGDGEALRGYLTLGRINYTALMLFDKCLTEPSTRKVPFRWRGRRMFNKFKMFRGDKNYGWAKFIGDGKIEVSFQAETRARGAERSEYW
ncbi:hypothetical protein DER44DRAFT_830989 [Fusarium oxysporum]|nr:hypothetical protein DER44DRAFT_830989 [Fusarium oxysporum]